MTLICTTSIESRSFSFRFSLLLELFRDFSTLTKHQCGLFNDLYEEKKNYRFRSIHFLNVHDKTTFDSFVFESTANVSLNTCCRYCCHSLCRFPTISRLIVAPKLNYFHFLPSLNSTILSNLQSYLFLI